MAGLIQIHSNDQVLAVQTMRETGRTKKCTEAAVSVQLTNKINRGGCGDFNRSSAQERQLSMRRRRLKVSLRLLLATTTLIAIFLALYVARLRQRKAAVDAIQGANAACSISVTGSKWMHRFLGDDEYFYQLPRISLGSLSPEYDWNTPLTDSSFQSLTPHLECLPELRKLTLVNTELSDDCVPLLCRLTNLERLDIGGTQISREGAQQLKICLPNCEIQGAR